ncbi:ATP-binding protein [Botrimarina hoheduenensis]|uniref:histidine kinase n=1 Tax=Botrimarina hoheduenensis TaxID=2528000 RepID=A0A5C5WD70_9BACT|nr:ATP-binding protein [Botrimarina hoheduenensis]TWT48630.1 Sensor protein ZraS [Botrimarina hoheduenensis]
MASLFVIRGRDQGQRYVLDEPELSIGRVGENRIRLHDTEVSREHAVLAAVGDSYMIRDLNSSNGTFVNGKAVRQRTLISGDQVQLGRTLMLYTGDGDSVIMSRDELDIVATADRDDGARILQSMSQAEGSDLLATPANQTQSPWLARARSNLQLMYRTALAVSHTLDIDQLLARIMDMIFEWVEADRGCILLKDEHTGELRPRVRRGRDGALGEGSQGDKPVSPIAISQTILEYVVNRREGVLTSNAGDDSRWDPAKSIMRMGVREAICVPMQGRYDLVGVIYIDTLITPKEMLERRSVNKFGEEHLKLMIAIAHQAALAVEDTSHYQAMVQAERLAAVGQTIATLSHHIKNILQGVQGGTYLIEQGISRHGKALGAETPDLEAATKAVEMLRQGWGIVEKNQDRISALVLDMLTYSKEREPDPEPTELGDLIEDVVQMMQARAGEVGVTLRRDPGPPTPTMMIDPEALHRALLNLVSNAIDACEDTTDGVVCVSVELCPEEEALRITVRDTGHGIEPDQLEAIFSAFVSNKGSRGTGLGLAVTRKTVEEHGGSVTVTSEVGNGSTFTIELPMSRAVDPENGPSPSATFIQPGT